MSMITDLADSVVGAISLHDFPGSEPFTAERIFVFDIASEDFIDLVIKVLPAPPTITPHSRSKMQWDLDINIAVTKSVQNLSSACDEMMLATESLMDALSLSTMEVGELRFKVTRITQTSIYDDDLLKEQAIFQSVFTLGFTAHRAGA